VEIARLLARYREEIEIGQLRVLFLDECHLMGGDVKGYGWGRKGERVEVPVANERDRQTYYGALDLLSKKLLIQAQAAGNTACTIAYLKFLQQQFANERLLILWDGASYHRGQQLRDFLTQVNDGLPQERWKIHFVQFAPNDPTQNPIEDVWLKAKTWLRNLSGLRPCFSALKDLFEQFFSLDIFDFPKMYLYGDFS
jgi:transposase